VPKNLFEQFSKMANLYFLILMFMQLYKPISDSGGIPTLAGPLLFVVGISMIKDAVEDNSRRKSDNQENDKKCEFVTRAGTTFTSGKARDIQVGNIIKIKKGELFPCDMLLIGSSKDKGVCYVETKNLDGETNLKYKQCDKSYATLTKTSDEAVKNFTAMQIDCEPPNEHIYNFDGNLKRKDGLITNVGPDQFLLRGCSL
jgi:P-type E1-E2 ATPase